MLYNAYCKNKNIKYIYVYTKVKVDNCYEYNWTSIKCLDKDHYTPYAFKYWIEKVKD